jgi:hypothetical protein
MLKSEKTELLIYIIVVWKLKRLPKLLFKQPFSYVRNYFTANTIGITNWTLTGLPLFLPGVHLGEQYTIRSTSLSNAGSTTLKTMALVT